jgi:DNA-binding response OmpR family regulator
MKRYSILIAEDDFLLANALQKMLEEKNYKVIFADNGLSALKLYNAHLPEVLLMDIDMPEKDGWEVLHQIREENKQIPIIIMTANKIEEADSLKSYDLGATVFVRKPFYYTEILALINALLKTAYDYAEELSFGCFLLNMSSYILQSDSKNYQLTEREAKVLYILGKNTNRTVETKYSLNTIWHNDTSSTNFQMLKNIITKLRNILKETDKMKVQSIYGKGYLLEFSLCSA